MSIICHLGPNSPTLIVIGTVEDDVYAYDSVVDIISELILVGE